MLPNRLIITEKSKRKAIYENSKNKWIKIGRAHV